MNSTSKAERHLGFGEINQSHQAYINTLQQGNIIERILAVVLRAIQSLNKLFGSVELNTAGIDNEISNLYSNKTGLISHKVGAWTENNSILVSQSAQETNEWKLEFIKSAQYSIEISGSICGGKVFREALRAIKDRLKEAPDLNVHILSTPDLLEPEDQKLLEELVNTHPNKFHCLITSFKFNSYYRQENHVKVVVVDQKYYVVGGTNYQDRLSKEAPKDEIPASIADKILGSGSSDMDVVGSGCDQAFILRREFFKLYAMLEVKEGKTKTLFNRYRPHSSMTTHIPKFDHHSEIHHNVKMKAVVGSDRVSGCVNEYAKLIGKADQAIHLGQMYFDPPTKIADALDKSNVPVAVVTTGIGEGLPMGNATHAYASLRTIFSLKKKNVQACTYDNGNNLYHKKILVSKRKNKESYAVVGSYNMGGKSHQDYEMILVIKDSKVAEKFEQILNSDIAKSKKVDFSKRKITLLERFLGRIQHSVFPILVG